MRCQSCGATVPPDAASCEYCGSFIASATGRLGRDVFLRIKNSQQYKERNIEARTLRLPKVSLFEKLFMGIFFTMFCGVAMIVFVVPFGMAVAEGMAEHGGGAAIPFFMGVVPLVMLVVGILMTVSHFQHLHQKEKGPVTAVPAIVVGKRTDLTGGGENNSPEMIYHATFETEDGHREEFQLWEGSLYGRIADEDGGVLYLRDRCAVDFDRVV